MELLLDKIYNDSNLNINKIAAFITSLLIGFISHSLLIFNSLYNTDSLWGKYAFVCRVDLGRFVGRIIENFIQSIDGIVNVQSFNVMICILFISLSAMKIVEIFKIKKLYISIIVSSLFILQPCIINVLGFWFVAHLYYVALFINLCSINMMLNKNKVTIPIIINTLVLGIYQIYIPVILTIGLIKFIIDIIDNNKNVKVFLNSLKYLIFNIISIILYIMLNKIAIAYYHVSIDNYAGMGENVISNISIIEYFNNFMETYSHFIDFIFNGYGYYSAFNIIIPIILFIILITVFLIIIILINIKKANRLLYIFYILLLIPSFDFGYIMSSGFSNIRIKTGHIFILILPLILIDKIKFDIIIQKINIKKIINTKIYPIIYMILTLFMMYICMGNHQALIDNNKDCYNTINYMCNMIINNPEYDNNTNIILVGTMDSYQNYISVNKYNKFKLHDELPLHNLFLDSLYKISFTQFGSLKIDNKVNSSEVKEYLHDMENFPSNKCMKKIDEYNLIFKLSD